VYDISLFFDDIGFCPFPIYCGSFSSTELWSFSGTLITTSNATSLVASKTVNSIDVYYILDLEKENNVLSLFEIQDKVKFVVKSEQDAKKLYRLTGTKPLTVIETIEDIIKFLLEQKNGYEQNINYVYQT
jgi:hypothetical protein